MKRCSKCHFDKPEEEFSMQLGRRRPRCKDCDGQDQRDRAQTSKGRQTILTNRKKIRDRNRQYLMDFYRTNPCVDCGEDDPVVLELDHVKGEKIGGVSQLVHNCRSLEVIQAEIDKCESVCANCHRRRTAKAQDWHEGLM